MIVFFLPNLNPGGAERVMLNVLLTYHEVYPQAKLVLLLGEKSRPLLSEVPATIPIYSLEAPNATKSVVLLLKFLKKNQPKVLFSGLGLVLASSVAKRFMSWKIVFINLINSTNGVDFILRNVENILSSFLYSEKKNENKLTIKSVEYAF